MGDGVHDRHPSLGCPLEDTQAPLRSYLDAPMTRQDTLSLIAIVDSHHTLRILPNGALGLLKDPKGRKGAHRPVEVVAEADATRRKAVELSLRVLKRPDRLTPGLLKAINLRLGDTPSQSLAIAAAYFGV